MLDGPEITVSVNPGGTVTAKRLPPEIKPHAIVSHAIALSRLIRGMRPPAHQMRSLAQITTRYRPFLSMNDIRCELSSPWRPESYKECTIGDGCLLDCYGDCEAKFPKM